MHEWKLAEAKNRLSELVNLVRDEGPQVIRRRSDAFVVLTLEHYHRLIGDVPSFRDHLLSMPDPGDIEFERDPSGMRDVDLGLDDGGAGAGGTRAR